jgi:uncharacterized membrane protein YhaH (DUF805 family)
MNYFILAYMNFLDYKTSTSRKAFVWFISLFYIFSFLIGFVSGIFDFDYLVEIYILISVPPYLSIHIRRLRDTGNSPYWGALALIPPFGYVLSLYCSLKGKYIKPEQVEIETINTRNY